MHEQMDARWKKVVVEQIYYSFLMSHCNYGNPLYLCRASIISATNTTHTNLVFLSLHQMQSDRRRFCP